MHYVPICGERSRIRFLWEQNTNWRVKLLIKEAWKQDLVWVNDIFIINKICESPRPAYILAHLNNVRTYLQVSRLSNVANKIGSEIMHWALHGSPTAFQLNLPKQRKPIHSNMELWRKIIRGIFCVIEGNYSWWLEPNIKRLGEGWLLVHNDSLHDIITQYLPCYSTLFGSRMIGDSQVHYII